MPARKTDDSMNRLVYLVREFGRGERGGKPTYREIQRKVVNPIRIRQGNPPLRDEGKEEAPYFRAIAEMYKAGKETKNPEALDWAPKMLKEILDADGRIKTRFVISITGEVPHPTDNVADVVLLGLPNGLQRQSWRGSPR